MAPGLLLTKSQARIPRVNVTKNPFPRSIPSPLSKTFKAMQIVFFLRYQILTNKIYIQSDIWFCFTISTLTIDCQKNLKVFKWDFKIFCVESSLKIS